MDDDDTEDQTQLEASSDGEKESEGENKGFIGTRESSVVISTSQAPSQASGSLLWRQATLGQKQMWPDTIIPKVCQQPLHRRHRNA